MLVALLAFHPFRTIAQTKDMKVFDSELFYIQYPNSYQTKAINNAPHMLVKLSNNGTLFTISVWDHEIDDRADIWDDPFVDHYSSVCYGNLYSIDRDYIKLKNMTKRCLKIKSNYTERSVTGKLLTYIFIDKGYLYVICHTSKGHFNNSSDTKEMDALAQGITIKE